MISPPKERIVKHFDDTVDHWRQLYDRNTGWHTYNDKLYRLSYVAEMVPTGPGVALDVGSGAGQFLIYLARRAYQAVGLEISRPMVRAAVERLKKEGVQRASVLVGDVEQIPCTDNQFDLYTAMGVIEYLEQDDPMIRECHRVLKPGGVGVITARNRLCPAVRWKLFYEDRARRFAARVVSPLRNGRMPAGRSPISREHDPAELKQTLRRHGFVILEERFCHFYVFPHPLSQFVKPIESFLAKRLEMLSETPLGVLGSTYIVKFRKLG